MTHELPFSPADILLPKSDLSKWATIACDQFTSQNDYWDRVKAEAGTCPSCYNITLPEIYLGGSDCEERIDAINSTMRQYIDEGLFGEYADSLILVERSVSGGRLRRGLVGKFRLADYDYAPGSEPLIRPTEGTVVSRIPARVNIRRSAALELPHVMILMDDAEKEIIESVDTSEQIPLYDFELMLGGGRIKGWLLSEKEKRRILSKLAQHAEKCRAAGELLFAVGDGNHSLAAAKACAELIGTEEAGFALAELVNVHNEGVVFEPIYRVVFNVDVPEFVGYIKSCFEGAEGRTVEYISSEMRGSFAVDGLEADVLQKTIDSYLSKHTQARVDYIHGEAAVRELAAEEGTVGFLFKGMKKSELFAYVNANGPLPRKTFSIGQAEDKRYYLEARRIRQDV